MFYQKIGKRLIDVAVSVALLPLQAAVFIVVAPLILLDDGAPVFYNAPRRGRNGKHFLMFKYRTMRNNAPDFRNADGSTVTSDKDPRVTRIGRVLRKTSIDEIPQLINVLNGTMSIIGPRPNLTRTPYEQLTDVEKKRLVVKPGITGYNQAYFRNSVSSAEKYENDLFYIENISFKMDLKIVAATLKSVVLHKNINYKT